MNRRVAALGRMVPMPAFLSVARDLPSRMVIRLGDAVRTTSEAADNLRSRLTIELTRRWPQSDLRTRLARNRAWATDFIREELLPVMRDLRTQLAIRTRRA